MTPPVNGNTDITMYIQQAQNLYSQVDSTVGGNAVPWVNSIFSAGYDIQGLASGDEQQKASAIQNLMNNVMSLISSITTNEAQTASSEVKNDEEKARRLNKTIEEQRIELNQQIGQIGGDISAQTKIVNGAVQELTDTQEAIQKKQEEINKIIAQIQEKQKELAGITDPTEQAKILSQIQSLSGNITTVVSSISELSSKVEAASTRVEDAAATIEDARGNAIVLQEQGAADITESAQKSAELTRTSISRNETGVIDTKAGEQLQAMAESILGAGNAPDLYRKANDLKLAGSTRTGGAITNLQTIMQGIGGLNDNASILSNFETSVGGALNSFDSAVGIWNQNLEPTITSLGSFSTITENIKTLDETVKEDLEGLPEEAQAAGGWAASAEPYDFFNPGALNTEEKEEEKNENKNDLKTPNVQLTAFEIKKPQA